METVNDTPPPSGPPPPYQEPGNRLTRSSDDKVVSGLAGGLGRHFGIDPVVFRIAFVVLTLAGGSGILLYLVGWLMIPDDTGGAALHHVGSERNQKLVAAALAGLGLVILLDDLLGGHDDIPVGLVLIGLGALFLWSRRNDPGGGAPPAPPSPPPPPPGTRDDERPLVPTPPIVTGPDVPPPTAEPKAPSAVVPVTLSLLAVLAGGLSLVGVPLSTGLALALLLTGGALVVGAWRGRARWLIPLGLVLSLALAVVSVIDVPVRGGSGDVSVRPMELADLRSPYRLAAGAMVLDLRDVDLQGRTVTVVASVAAGTLEVVVPDDVALELNAHVGAGELDVLGRHSEGLDLDGEVDEPGREGAGRLVLRPRVGLGQVEVRRAPA